MQATVKSAAGLTRDARFQVAEVYQLWRTGQSISNVRGTAAAMKFMTLAW